MTPQQQRILSFFGNEFDLFVLPDLRVLSEIRPDRKGLRACTIPQAMLVFSIFDLLGYLINPDVKASKQRTLKNYRALFTSPLALFPPEYQKETDRIVQLFRHGLIHQFFPKASSIAKVSNPRPLIFPDGKISCLNVDKLSTDTIAAIDRLRTLIAKESHRALASQMSQRLDSMNKEDYDKLNELS